MPVEREVRVIRGGRRRALSDPVGARVGNSRRDVLLAVPEAGGINACREPHRTSGPGRVLCPHLDRAAIARR